MLYRSTRGQVDPIPFSEAVLMGLADDGGLLVPERIPQLENLEKLAGLAYPELASHVMTPFVDLDQATLDQLLEQSYGPDYEGPVAPVETIGPFGVLELFHGPTLAFKDVALQFLGRLFDHILRQRDQVLNVVAATSGDTGSAAIHGLRHCQRAQIFVMHPSGRIAPLQELQMTTVLDPGVYNLAVEGTFDDCQQLLKQLSGDLDFKSRHHLGAVNSVNWARVLAQIVYYFAAYFQVARYPEPVRFAVPTGNFGNILAGWFARSMGLPIEQLVLASNHNDILPRFFSQGSYRRGQVHHTLAPAMDIQVSSNFERFLYFALGESASQQAMADFESRGSLEARPDHPFRAVACPDEEILATIARVHAEHDYLLDPHTASAWWAAEQFDSPLPTVVVATAHPAKFPDAIERALGRPLAVHPRLEALRGLPTRRFELPNQLAALREFVASRANPLSVSRQAAGPD